jgi:hypothetical protein
MLLLMVMINSVIVSSILIIIIIIIIIPGQHRPSLSSAATAIYRQYEPSIST